ncbi:neuroblastoma breakpoint family member 6-like, partial [Sus scrofa]|uniref:neuroblastoma breakpoint family member 6-like n=1 Tax=Sus scrofa TaxID=9823 RepID=UPI000A2B0E3E
VSDFCIESSLGMLGSIKCPKSVWSMSLGFQIVPVCPLRELDVLIHAQARELTQLRQKVKEGRDDCVLLVQHLTDLLTHKDLDKDQGQGLREQLTEGHRLAERLARKFSPESDEEEEDNNDKAAALTPSVEVQEVAKEEVLQESQDECISTPSMVQERSDCTQPSSDGTRASDEPKVGPATDGACAGSRAKEDDVPTRHPAENQNGHEEVDGQEPLPPSAELQEVAKEEVLQAFPDEAVLAPCIQQEGSDCYPPCSDGKLAFDEQKKGSVLDGACGCSPATEGEIPAGPPESQNDHNGVKEPEPPVPRLRGELPPMAECGVPQNSLDGSAWSCPGLPDLSDSFWPYRSAATLSFENMDVPDAQDATSDTWEDCHQVPLSFGRPEMQSSQAQLQTSTQVANDLQLPLDQHLDRGDGKARLHLSPTIRGFTANTDTGDQGPLIQELGLDASIRMKTPPKLEGEGSAASRQECRVSPPSCLKFPEREDYPKKTAVQQVETGLQIPWPPCLGYRGICYFQNEEELLPNPKKPQQKRFLFHLMRKTYNSQSS